jgi:HEAT repeat protein
MMALGEIGPEAVRVVDRVVAALDHPQSDVRRGAADVLARLGPQTIEPLAARIRQGSLSEPAPAAYVLGAVIAPLRQDILYQPAIDRAVFDAAAGPVIRSAAPALAGLLADSRQAVRQAAQQALSQLGILAVPVLLNLLDQQDAVLRQSVLETLVRCETCLPPRGAGSEPLMAVKRALLARLMERMQQPDSQVRAAAHRTFAAMDFAADGQAALPLLRRALRDENLAVRRYADQSLRQLGSEP